MIKKALIALILALVLVTALPFFTLGPKGEALLRFSDLREPGLMLAKLKRWRNPLTGERVSEPDTFYKWRDRAGQWHYSTQAPAEGVAVEVLIVDSNTNVIPPLVEPSE